MLTHGLTLWRVCVVAGGVSRCTGAGRVSVRPRGLPSGVSVDMPGCRARQSHQHVCHSNHFQSTEHTLPLSHTTWAAAFIVFCMEVYLSPTLACFQTNISYASPEHRVLLEEAHGEVQLEPTGNIFTDV